MKASGNHFHESSLMHALSHRLPVAGGLSLILAAAAVTSYLKGFLVDVQGWGIFYWWTTYSHGAVKRGLVGSLFQGLTDGTSTEIRFNYIIGQHFAFCMLLIAGLWLIASVMIWRTCDSVVRLLVASTWLIFFSSQFLPTMGYLTGYLDIHLMVLLASALIAAVWRRYVIAAIIAAMAPLVHEIFIFLWLTAVVLLLHSMFVERRDVLWRSIVIGIPFLTTAIVLALHSQEAVVAELAAAPIDDEMRSSLINVQFGQSIFSAFTVMMIHYDQHFSNFIVSAIYFLLPTILIVVSGSMAWRRREQAVPMQSLALHAAAFAPLLTLLFAWDLSRFLVTSNFTAIIAFAYLTFAVERRA